MSVSFGMGCLPSWVDMFLLGLQSLAVLHIHTRVHLEAGI